MELTIHIKEQVNVDAFLDLIKEIEYIEVVSIKESSADIPIRHKELLDNRLQKIEDGQTTFKNWDLFKKKYENKTV